MNFDEVTLIATQKASKFDLLYIEKVLRLLDILEAFFAQSELNGKYALKGGTALNLFHFNLPRLSVDIDLNYLGLDRETMLRDREAHDNILRDLLTQRGYVLKRIPSEHAGGKWRLGYRSFTMLSQNIELDLNYMHRIPLLPIQRRDSFPLEEQKVMAIPILDIHELAAGKLCALIARCKPRDLFDAYSLLNHTKLDQETLRRCFVTYAAFNKLDFSAVDNLGELKFNTQQFRQELIETLPVGYIKETPKTYLELLLQGCREKLKTVLPFSEKEHQFLTMINRYGQIHPELLTDSDDLQRIILAHPMLQWKVFNVREHHRTTT